MTGNILVCLSMSDNISKGGCGGMTRRQRGEDDGVYLSASVELLSGIGVSACIVRRVVSAGAEAVCGSVRRGTPACHGGR